MDRKGGLFGGLILGFALAAVFITLLVSDAVTDSITDGVIDGFVEGCDDLTQDPNERELCKTRANRVRGFEVIDENTCGGTGPEQLGLVGADLTFCEEGIGNAGFLISLRTGIKSVTSSVSDLGFLSIGVIISVLFILGLVVGLVLIPL